MRHLLAATTTAVVLLNPGLTQAAMVAVIDTFDAPSQFVFDASTASGATTSVSTGTAVNAPHNTVVNRTVTHELLLGTNAGPPTPGSQSNVRVGDNPNQPPGTLVISNAAGRDAQVNVSWTLPGNFLPAMASGYGAVQFDLLFSDQDVNASLYFDDALFGSLTLAAYDGLVIPQSPVAKASQFLLTSSQWDTISKSDGKTLRLQLDGPTGWDLSIDNLRVAEVPEPGSLAVVSVGLAALASATRRRRPGLAVAHTKV